MRATRFALLGLLLAIASIAAAGTAGASRAPTHAERAAIIHAWAGGQSYPARCLVIRVSTINRRWAGLTHSAKPSSWCVKRGRIFDGGNFLKRRDHGGWRLVISQSESIGNRYCKPVPAAVERELWRFASAAGCA